MHVLATKARTDVVYNTHLQPQTLCTLDYVTFRVYAFDVCINSEQFIAL